MGGQYQDEEIEELGINAGNWVDTCFFKVHSNIVLPSTPRPRWEDNIRMDLEEIGINAGNWVDLAQDRNYWRALVNAPLNLRVL